MATDKQDALDAMSSEFIAEIKDDLASLETDLLAMEEKGAEADDDLINHAFRSIHSIKGGAGFLNFKELSGLSHVMESVLMQIREKKRTITSPIVDALLAGFDRMKLMVDLMGKGESCDYSEQEAALKEILSAPKESASGDMPEEPSPAALEKTASTDLQPEDNSQTLTALSDSPYLKDKVFSIDKGRFDNALAGQKYIYTVCLLPGTDITADDKTIEDITEEIKSIGDILFMESPQPSGQGPVYYVVATILDFPLIRQVLEVEDSRLALADKQFADIAVILKSLDARPSDKPKPPVEKAGPVSQRPSDKTPAAASPMAAREPDLSESSAQTIRINVELISRLMNRAGELVLSRNQLRPLMGKMAEQEKSASHVMQNLDMVTTDIQEAIMQMRMQPVIDLLGKYRRVVRDIARRISKKVDLVLEGSDVEMDRNVLEKLANPVTHLIRNCIDHGIESPEQRRKIGKPETGTIKISAFHQGGYVHLCIRDDGAGIDPQLVLSKAFEKGLVTEEQISRMSDKQKVNLIFLPGFSTSETITDISGRGVGMDVVKTNIKRLRGRIEIESEKGAGTQVHMIIPLTLAIVPSLIVSTGQQRFAIPQVNIKEVIFLEPGQIHSRVETIGGSEVLRLRESLLPVLRLRNVLGIKTLVETPAGDDRIEERRKAIADRRQKKTGGKEREKRSNTDDRRMNEWDAAYVIVLKVGDNRFGLCVDELHDIEEVVVEPLSEYIKNLQCFSGATILGDGNVIMILDVSGIASASSLRFDSIRSEEQRRNRTDQDRKTETEKHNLIVFCNDSKEYFALPLEQVYRLETVDPKEIHQTGQLRYIEYHNTPVMLVSMDELFPSGPCDIGDKEVFAIFPKFVEAKVGILASQIIDTVEVSQSLSRDDTCSEAVLGKLFKDEMMIQVLDHQSLGEMITRKVAQSKGNM